MNPYKNLDIYSMQHMAQYRGREMFEVSPHVYAVADACQRVLRQQVRGPFLGEISISKYKRLREILQFFVTRYNSFLLKIGSDVKIFFQLESYPTFVKLYILGMS